MVGKCKKQRADFARYKLMPYTLDEKTCSIMTGLLLGDGFIPATSGRHNCFSFEQSSENSEYVDVIFEFLRPYTNNTTVKTVVNDKRKWNKGVYVTKRFRTCTHPVFTDLRKKWYNKHIKIVPNDIHLDWTAVSYWFADDGHSRKNGKELVLCSESFTKEENLLLIERLKKDLEINSTLTPRSGGSGVGIRILSSDYFSFVNGISPIIKQIQCIAYKVDTSNATKRSTPRYSKEDKLKAVNMVKNGCSLAEASATIGCCMATIKRWSK